MAGLFDDLIPGGAKPGSIGGNVKISPQDAKRYNDVEQQGDAARNQFQNLVRAYGLTQATPTGYLQNAWQGIRRMFGAGDGTTQDREQMQALQDQMVMGLRQPGAGAISDTERESFRGSLFSPSYQPEANRGIIDAQIRTQLSDLAKARLASQWKGKYGSIGATDPSGRTYDDAVNDFFQSAQGQAALRPFSQRLSEQVQSKRAAPTGGVPGFKVIR